MLKENYLPMVAKSFSEVLQAHLYTMNNANEVIS